MCGVSNAERLTGFDFHFLPYCFQQSHQNAYKNIPRQRPLAKELCQHFQRLAMTMKTRNKFMYIKEFGWWGMGKGAHTLGQARIHAKRQKTCFIHTSCFGAQACHHPVWAPGLSSPPKPAGKPMMKNESREWRLKNAQALPSQKCELLQCCTLDPIW